MRRLPLEGVGTAPPACSSVRFSSPNHQRRGVEDPLHPHVEDTFRNKYRVISNPWPNFFEYPLLAYFQGKYLFSAQVKAWRQKLGTRHWTEYLMNLEQRRAAGNVGTPC